MKIDSARVSLLVCLMVASGCGKPSELPRGWLADVNGTGVTVAEFVGEFARRPGLADTPENRRLVLEELIQRRGLAQHARELGLMNDPEVARGLENLLIGRLRALELEPRLRDLTITAHDIATSYAASRERFRRPGMLRLAALHLPNRDGDPARRKKDRARLEQARQAALENVAVLEGFGVHAIECTTEQSSRYRGGILGWLHEEGAYPDWRRSAVVIGRSLTEPGDVSEVVETDDGQFVVRLLARRPAEIRPLTEVEGMIERDLLRQKRQDLEAGYHESILAACRIERSAARLSSVEIGERRERGEGAATSFLMSESVR